MPRCAQSRSISHTGLHYGPTFASKSGEAERAQPLLMLKMPSFHQKKLDLISQNAQMYTTAFDVHETILDVFLGSIAKGSPGLSLVQPLPKGRTQCRTTEAIPSNFCPLIAGTNQQHHGQCNFMVDPPSVFSFYSDIPPSNRPTWPIQCPVRKDHSTVVGSPNGQCFCATDKREWFDCSSLSRLDFQTSANQYKEQYSLRSCGNHELDESLELNIHVTKNDKVVETRKALAAETKSRLASIHGEESIKAFDNQPNIIFLEIDSVSLSYSERYFPKTWSLLNQHKIVKDKGVTTCPTGWCAGVFNKTSVVGQSSIVNQLAALSGCLDHKDPDEKLQYYQPSTHCYTDGKHSLGADEKGVSRDHWLFGFAKCESFKSFPFPRILVTNSSLSLNSLRPRLPHLFR